MGIQASEVDTAEEARAIVRLAKYPPIGNRGISGQGPHTGDTRYDPATPPICAAATKTSSYSRQSNRSRIP